MLILTKRGMNSCTDLKTGDSEYKRLRFLLMFTPRELLFAEMNIVARAYHSFQRKVAGGGTVGIKRGLVLADLHGAISPLIIIL